MDDARVFRAPWWLKLIVVLAFASFTFIAVWFYLDDAFHPLDWFAIALSLFAGVAVIDAFVTRVELTEERMTLVSNFRKRVLLRSDVKGVSSGKGVGISVQRLNDEWVELPSVDLHANTIRAWVRRGEKEER